MADVQPVTMDFAARGLMLGRPGDVIEGEYYTNIVNMTAYRQHYLQTRMGITTVHAYGALGAAPHSQARMISAGTASNYQGVSTSLFRQYTSIDTGYSGAALTMESYKIANCAFAHMIVFDATKRMKDPAFWG